MKLTSIKTMILATKKGKMALVILTRDISAIFAATNKQTPTGGVITPIIKLAPS